MPEIVQILAATDFSPAADRAANRAASLAATFGGTLHMTHVLPPQNMLAEIFPTPLEREALRARAERALRDRAQRIAAQFGITPTCQLFQGRAHQAILDGIESLAADVVVLGAQGEHEGVRSSETVGDTALKVAERSRVATVLVRRKAEEHYRHVVACVKGVLADRLIIGWANSMSPDDLIHIVSAYTVPYEGRLVEWGASKSTIDVYATREHDERARQLSVLFSELGLPPARARLHLERGEPLQTILHNANNMKADLIIVGRRAQVDSLAEGAFGSIARHAAFLAPMDVMIVPPDANW